MLYLSLLRIITRYCGPASNYTLVGRWPRRINWWSGVSGGGSSGSNVPVIIAIWLKCAIQYCVLARMLVRANLLGQIRNAQSRGCGGV